MVDKNIGFHLLIKLGSLAGKYPECDWLHELVEDEVRAIRSLPAKPMNGSNDAENDIPAVEN